MKSLALAALVLACASAPAQMRRAPVAVRTIPAMAHANYLAGYSSARARLNLLPRCKLAGDELRIEEYDPSQGLQPQVYRGRFLEQNLGFLGKRYSKVKGYGEFQKVGIHGSYVWGAELTF